ncbi:hypothetical protein CK203_033422 [Vitis vinifera]|uniref:Uncharacterized protein n=1 Tax=Vitis vinifera TaxID=29760 RepID=A0A438HMM3_VITVI|nr:hypothetical protein CK203_033422 [Vitis vinifera]
MLECKPTKNPIDLNHKFSAVTNGAPMDKERYQRHVRRLTYGEINLSFPTLDLILLTLYLLLNEKGEKVEEQLGVVLANTVE